jgi:hypothetical protein
MTLQFPWAMTLTQDTSKHFVTGMNIKIKPKLVTGTIVQNSQRNFLGNSHQYQFQEENQT